LKISSKLTPLRIACSGGKYPLNTEISDDEDDMGEGTDSMNTDADNEDGEDRKKAAKNHSTTATTYSKFVFKSKFQALLKQLKKIRDDEPDCKFRYSSYSCIHLQFPTFLRTLFFSSILIMYNI